MASTESFAGLGVVTTGQDLHPAPLKGSPHSFLPGEGNPFLLESSLLVLSNAGLKDGATQAKRSRLTPLLVQLLSGILFHCITKISLVDSRVLPEFFLFVDSHPIVDLCRGVES